MKQLRKFVFALASVSRKRLLIFLLTITCTAMYAQQEVTGNVVDPTGVNSN